MKDAVKKTARVLTRVVPAAVLLAFTAFLLCTCVNAAEQVSVPAPYATSREEAITNRVFAFASLGFSANTIVRILRATAEPGERVSITDGYYFDAIVWAGRLVRRNVIATPTSPSVPAEKWVVGTLQVFLIRLPGQDYFNWGVLSTKSQLACLPSGVEHIPLDHVSRERHST